jgi:thiol-disulfide isomerase/thioredoxin
MSTISRVSTLALCLLLAALWSACRPEAPAQDDPLVGQPAPAFQLPMLDGSREVSLASLEGKVVLLDFWATWCPPCEASMPDLQRIHEHFAGRPFQMLSVNVDAPEAGRVEHVQRWMERRSLSLPTVIDNGLVSSQYRATRIPRGVLIDRRGQVRQVFRGRTSESRLRRAIEALLAEPA